jgi:UbiD family decarboxylase
LRAFIDDYTRAFPDEVIHVEEPLDARWEISALCSQLEREKRFPLLIFHNVLVDGQRSDMPLVTFLTASRARLAYALGADVRTAGLALHERMQARPKTVQVTREEAPVKEVVERGAEVDVRRFPALWHHTMDPGRYITEGLFLTYNRLSRRDNSAMHRGWLADRDEIRVLLGPSTHNAYNLREYEEAGEDMPAAFWVGHHPLALLGAASHVGPDDSHYEAAGAAQAEPLRLVPSETLGQDFLVPADAEVVIEGYVPRGQRRPEGPFGEYTRHFGPQRWGPFLKVTAVTYRRDALWDDVIVGHTHWISALKKEGEVFRLVSQSVRGLKAVHAPMSGTGGFHVYMQIRKTLEGQGRTALAVALSSFLGTKHAWVFDEDVDIFDEKEVLLAMATRFQGDRDLLVLSGVTGSPLDPSSDDGRRTAKVGFDCTKPLGQPFADKLSIPPEVVERVDAARVLGRGRLDRVTLEPWG